MGNPTQKFMRNSWEISYMWLFVFCIRLQQKV